MEHLLVGLASIVVLGISAQWVAWRLHLPAILLLLVVGFLAGPVFGLIHPNEIFGDLLFPIVSLSVAIILFEGGLSLNIAELGGIGRVVRNLIGIGILVTWVSATILAYYLLGFSLPLAVLLGAILVVTGPTVIVPMLRQIRPNGRVGDAIKWEGIVNDPFGAIIAVLVLEVILAGGFEQGLAVASVGILQALFWGSLVGLAGAAIIVLILRFYLVPDFLQNPVALTLVLFVFAAANMIQGESGLLAVTVMGAALASQQFVTVKHIVEFKEDLRVLLISALFIMLAARLPLVDPTYWSPRSLLFVAVLIVVVRPAAVALATWGSQFNWRERVFLGFMAPRGIVAAAVASIFAIDLADTAGLEADRLVSVTFMVIVGTVTVYGITAPIVARRLGVATPNPHGFLMVGAAKWIRDIAHVVEDQGLRVVLVDSNWTNVTTARRDGLTAYYLNILDEGVEDEIDLYGIGRLLSLTTNDEVNALAALHFGELFGRANVFQLPLGDHPSGKRRETIPEHLRGRWVFRQDATHEFMQARVRAGGTIKRTNLTEEFTYQDFIERYGESAIPLFIIRGGDVSIMTVANPMTPKAGQTLISLVDEPEE
ncbi:MAG: sodium:proton antiporter [Gemmatimonadales bacterium]